MALSMVEFDEEELSKTSDFSQLKLVVIVQLFFSEG
jgi:hypothetical protein